jgi:predicted RNase H-like HicB family nuclease
MLYQVMLIKSEEGYSVSCPSLPGCWSQGETKQEALDNIREAITEYKAAVAEMRGANEMCEIEVAA